MQQSPRKRKHRAAVSDKHQTCDWGEARQQWVEGVVMVVVEVQKMNYWVQRNQPSKALIF